MKKQVPIVFLTDNNYVVPTAAAIQSVLEHYTGSEKLAVHVICAGVSPENKVLFMKFNSDRVEVGIVDTDNTSLSQYNEDGYYVTATGLLKFCIPRLLPQYDKILYLDGDILVQKDITEMFKIDVDGYYTAAVADMAAMEAPSLRFHQRLHRIRYFNSGVLLLNAKRIRESGTEQKLFEIKKIHPEYQCMDQDVFNDVFHDEVKYLPPKWNAMIYNFQRYDFGPDKINIFYNTDYSSLKELIEDAYLIHLTNEFKPWKYSDAFMAQEWMETFLRSPFKEMKIERQPMPKKTISKDGQESHLLIHFGPFLKDWTWHLVTLYFLRIPVVRLFREENLRRYTLLGLPVLTRYFDELETRTVIFGIPVRKRVNFQGLQDKITRCFAELNSAVDRILPAENTGWDAAKTEEQREILAQIQWIKNLQGTQKAE